MHAEEKITGKVGLRDYRNYLSYSLGVCGIILYIFICSASAIAQLAVSLFLAEWASQDLEEQQKSYYPKAMVTLIGISFGAAILREATIFNIIIRSTSNLHRAMATKIVRAKVVFFDSTPIGRILTRFSKDMAILDIIIPTITVLVSYGLFRTISVSIALCIVNFWLLIPLALACLYFLWVIRQATQAMVEA